MNTASISPSINSQGGGYAVDHSSVIYLLGPDGKLVKFYDEATTPDQLAKDLNGFVQ